jgi:hypothetical protein
MGWFKGMGEWKEGRKMEDSKQRRRKSEWRRRRRRRRRRRWRKRRRRNKCLFDMRSTLWGEREREKAKARQIARAAVFHFRFLRQFVEKKLKRLKFK